MQHQMIERHSPALGGISRFWDGNFLAREGKSTANTLRICEHFNALLHKIHSQKPNVSSIF